MNNVTENGEPIRDELLEELSLDIRNLGAREMEGKVYRILRDMMIVDEIDYETYQRFKKRFEAELAKKGQNEETNVH